MAERTLPDVKTRFRVDYSDLTKAEKAAARMHGEFQSGAQKSTTHTLRFQQSLTTLMDHFGGMPPIVNQAGRSIESMASQGASGMAVLGAGALIAVGTIAEIAKSAEGTYIRIGDEVENFRRVTGASADESSRMIHVFNDLGVSGDTAAQGMFKFSKAIETKPKELRDLGVVVAYNAEGNVNLSKTLFAVADAYNATADPARRNLLLFTAFGRAGREMIPILEQGSVALQRMEDSAHLLFTEEDLQRLKDMKIHTAEVKSLWDEWWAANVGSKIAAVQDAVAESALRGAYVQEKLNEAVKAGTISQNDLSQNMGQGSLKVQDLTKKYGSEFDQSLKTRDATQKLSQAIQDEKTANDELVKSIDDVINKEESQHNASLALQLANIAVAGSQDKITEAGKAYDKAVKEYGVDSTEARDAARNVQTALIDQEKAYYADAAAARKLQEDTDLATIGQKDVAKETQVYIDQLQAEANSLDANSPLRANLQAYINTLKTQIPTNIYTTLHISLNAEERNAARLALAQTAAGFQHGGRPPIGRVVMVGEAGPEPVVFDQPATVYPHGTQVPGNGGGLSVTVNAQTNADAQDIARDAAWELRKMRRNY